MSLSELLQVFPVTEDMQLGLTDREFDARLDRHWFYCEKHQRNFNQVLYGGQVFAQAIAASLQTVDEKFLLHSASASFLRPGSDAAPVQYEVIILRDGRSVVSRTVQAWQQDKLILTMQLSFHKSEPGYHHQPNYKPSISPSSTDFSIVNSRLDPQGIVAPFDLGSSVDCPLRSVDKQSQSADLWIRCRENLQGVKRRPHSLALAYASDLTLLATALLPHETSLFSKSVMAATITHHMWFHDHDFSSSEWLLFAMNSPWSGSARGFCRGEFYTEQGKLIASVVQEGLIRPLSR